MAKLVFKNTARSGETVDVDVEIVIGREGVDLMIDDAKASRRHAAVRPRDGGLEIEDLGSMNGTFVNSSRIEGTVALTGGDVVQIGDTAMEVEVEQAAAGETVLQDRPASPPVSDPAPAPVAPPAVATPAPPAVSSAAPAPEQAAAPPAPAPPPQQAPFVPGPAAGHPVGHGRRRAASRLLAPSLFALVTIAATAAALVVYFAMR